MIELVIHGRGGRGGVTLAKLIASSYFLGGLHAQAFGVYGAERTGAPVQAYVRIDVDEILTHNAVASPNHIVVMDESLIAPGLSAGMDPAGWLVVNSPLPPGALAERLPGRNVATVDADTIATTLHLGSAAVPIVNTALFGAVARTLGLGFATVELALEEADYAGANIEAARAAYDHVSGIAVPGALRRDNAAKELPLLGFLSERIGAKPTTPTGSWASRRPHTQELAPPCAMGCEAGNDVRGFVQAASRREYREALAVILETSPFPGTCGRVCPAPCMGECNRQHLDSAVDVRDIERAVADGDEWPLPTVPFRDERVAVVGSGPAGLSAAYHLARAGYPVTVIEGSLELGGILRTGIPEYRLPRAVLDREIDFILRHGVEIETGWRVDNQGLRQLAREYAAVFVATGLQAVRSLDLDVSDGGTITQGLEFLDAARRGGIDLTGQSVVVVGGGNTAVDAARTALRLRAADVHLVYRRTRTLMPAIREEVAEAVEEGVKLVELALPVRLARAGKGTVLECRRIRLGPPDTSGRASPEIFDGEGATFKLPCDRLLVAVGQGRDLAVLPEAAASTSGPFFLSDSTCPIFLGGDFAEEHGTVAAAIGSGRKAGRAIHEVLADEAVDSRTPQNGSAEGPAVAGLEAVRLEAFASVPPEVCVVQLPVVRSRNFQEVRLGLVGQPEHDPVSAEAERCLSCGACNGCDTCTLSCPEGVVSRANGGEPEFDYEYCKGCGLCAVACPRGVVFTEAV